MKAVVKGETHLSKKDKQALMQMDLSEFDAVFREGYDTDYFKRDITSMYALFGIGHLVYGATFGRLYFSLDEMKEDAEEKGVGFHDEIDSSVRETYEMVSVKKQILLLILSPFLGMLILGLVSAPFQIFLPDLSPMLTVLTGYVAGLAVILFFGFVWALGFFMLIVDEVMYDRDEHMAENIIEISEEEGYEKVLVSCGGEHLSGISSYLEENGWETEERTTDSPIGKVLLWKDKVLSAVLNPRNTLSKAVSKIRSSI
ncbi:hypothetical protein BRC72_11615 [Halobacteriales archaeon QH_7_66_36]|nr:MAG: hypothetical protein BRC72_11615 [Halobacteriales archaeon QH_7_66_36]